MSNTKQVNMWGIIAIVVVLTYIGLRILIYKYKQEFDLANAESKKKSDKMVVSHCREDGDTFLGAATGFAYVNRQTAYVKQKLKRRGILWLARILTAARIY